MAVQWLTFTFGLVAGIVLALLIRAGLIELVRRNQMAKFTYKKETDELELSWVNVPTAKKPVLKVDGKEAIPLLKKGQKKIFNGRPAFFLDAKTGEAFNIDPEDPEHRWPSARDRLAQWKSIREPKIANAANNDNGLDLLKWGAIGGIVAGAMSILLVVLMWQTFGGLA